MIEPQPNSADVIVQDIAFDTIYNTDTDKKTMPIAVRPRGVNFTIRRCSFYHVGDALNANSRPVGVLMQDCVVPGVAMLRSYIAWVEGTDQAYLGNFALNSTREAVMRVGDTGGERILIAHNTFANVDRKSAGDATDTAKNALTVQYGSHIYIADNTLLVGPVIIGPLGQGDGFPWKDQRLREIVVEGNRFARNQLRIAHGTIGLMARNNRFWANDRTAINIEGFNRDYNRGSADVTIAHNTAFNQGDRGNFLRIGGRADGVRVINNLYVAPNLSPGSYETAVVYVHGRDLASIEACEGNVWPACKPQEFARGGVFYVWPSWSNAEGYLTLDKWRENAAVKDDVQIDVSVDESLKPAKIDEVARRPAPAGVHSDAIARSRDRKASLPGALED
jgi:hypothetical protein